MKTSNAENTALVALLPKRMWAEINTWRQVYDPNYCIFPPHVTVAYPPFVPEAQWPFLRLAVRQCLGQFRPFRILLRGLGAFETSRWVLWLQVEDEGQLSSIRTSLMHCLPEHVLPLPFAYVPHVTIGVFESPSELKEAELAMRGHLKPRSFTVRHLTYLFPDERGVWSVCSHVPLGIRDEPRPKTRESTNERLEVRGRV